MGIYVKNAILFTPLLSPPSYVYTPRVTCFGKQGRGDYYRVSRSSAVQPWEYFL